MKWNDSIEAEYQDTTADRLTMISWFSRLDSLNVICDAAAIFCCFPSSFFLHHRFATMKRWKCMQNRYAVECTLILLSMLVFLLFFIASKPRSPSLLYYPFDGECKVHWATIKWKKKLDSMCRKSQQEQSNTRLFMKKKIHAIRKYAQENWKMH